jgi:hypothetical protein
MELSENVLEYEESITYLKHNKPDFQDIKVHEELVKELHSKPLSWISKNEPKIDSPQHQEESKVV